MQLFEHQAAALDATKDLNRVAIPGYAGLYEIDTQGNVYSLLQTKSRRKGILKTYTNENGYTKVNLYDVDGKCKKKYIHRLVAVAFIPNPNDLKVVNHIDCNKQNNNVSNLEWCTQKHNIHEAMKNNLERHREVKITNLKTNETKTFYSMRKTSEFFKKYPNFIMLERKKRGNVFTFSDYRIEVI